MDYKICYSERSLSDLAEFIHHVSEERPEAAFQVGSALLDHIDLLAKFPRLGHVVHRHPTVRRLVHSPLLVYYRIQESPPSIEVMHIRHSARFPLYL